MSVESIHDGRIKVRLLSGAVAFRRRGWNVGRFHIDAERTGLFVTAPPPRRSKDEDPEPAPELPLESWTGLPVLLKCVCPRGRPANEGAAPSDALYQIERRYPDGRVTPAEWYSAGEIRKGEYLDRQFAAITGRRDIDADARVIFAQLHAFAVPIEYPVRHSGFSGPGEAPAYVLHDGRALLPGGRVSAGSIAGQEPLLQRKRHDRWQDRFQTIPTPPPSEAEAGAAVGALLTFDPAGRALCAAFLGARALFYSLRSMDVACLLTGLRGTAKTSIGQIMHWAEGPCAAADEPDMSFRTTFLGSELMSDRARDCAFLIDDGERARANDPGAPLKPDIVALISNRTREAFDGAPAKIRGGRSLSLAAQRRTAQLLAFSAETALGLEASVLARTIWWSFERGEIVQAPMLSADWQETPTWRACNEVFTGCGHGALRRVLDLWGTQDRAAAVRWLREIDLEASAIAATAELGGEAEDRPRVQRGLAMIIAGAMLCDAGAQTENYFRDLALAYGAPLAAAQLDRLASGTTATVGFDRAWFRDAFEDLITSGDQLWLDARTGRFLGEGREAADAHWLIGLGYQWRPEAGFVPIARSRGGWMAEGAYWAEPGALYAWLHRKIARTGGDFPFNRQTLPAHLVRLGLATADTDGRNTHKPWVPLSDPDLDKGRHTRVIVIPLESLDAEICEKTPDLSGKRGRIDLTDWKGATKSVPAMPETAGPLENSGVEYQREAGSDLVGENQPVSPHVPAVPASKPESRTFTNTPARWPDRAAAIGADGLWIIGPDGRIEASPPPAKSPSTLGELAALAIERRLTQLWVHPSLTFPLELPEALTPSEGREGLNHPFADAGALPDGWRLGTPGKVKAWNRAASGGQESHVILSAFDHHTWPFGLAEDAAGELAAVEAFRVAIGGFWPRLAPAVTFEAMMRALHKGGTDLSASVAAFPKPMLTETVDQCWLTPAGPGAFVIAADKGAAYLAAMTSLDVGFGEPAWRPGGAFDARTAGYWRAKVTMPPEWPDPFPPIGKAKGDWFVTPTLALAAQAGASIEIREAWLFPETHQPFQPIWKRLKDARAALQAQAGEPARLALAAVKSLYTRGVGNLAGRAKRDAASPIDLHRPDWRHFIMAAAQANILRNLRTAGLRPFGLRTDAIYLTASSPDLATVAPKLRQGIEPGAWRTIGAMPAADLPAVYRAPSPPGRAQARLDALTQLLAGKGEG